MTDEYRIVETEAGLEFQGAVAAGQELEYFAPHALIEAESFKNKTKGYHYFAGGTILNWRGSPKVKGLIDLKHLQLGSIDATPTHVSIGAMATIQEVAAHPDLPAILKQAASYFTSKNVRNMATIGGTATGNFFVSDVLPVLAAFNAEIEYFHNGSKQTTPLATWLQSKPGIICALIINKVNRTVKLRQEKIAKSDFPLIVTAIGFDVIDNKVQDPVVAISGATSNLILSASGATYLAGKQLADIEFEALNVAVQKDFEPAGSVKATPRVKRRIVESHLKAMVEELKG